MKGEVLLNRLGNQQDRVDTIVTDVKELIECSHEIMPASHSRFYALASNLYRAQEKHSDYNSCINYLSTVDLSTISPVDKIKTAFLLTVAALLGDEIYNLGELLFHPIVRAVEFSPISWIVVTLRAVSDGNVEKFN